MTACLTGYTLADLARLERSSVTCAHFFQRAPAMNPDRALITDKVCGVRVWDLLIRDIRYLGKLVDELPKGPLWSRFSGKTSMSRSFWGACGAGISAGQFLAIATASTPLAREPWGLSNQMTARALDSIGKVGGPRCCKRDSWLAVQAAVDFVREHLGVEMQHSVPVCSYSARNSQCIGKRCPFSAAKQRALEAKTAPSF